ncbi:proto-oncogene dbl [Limosa lapponica baueri]|uniref:Proto-oncogene dbl n=1 Tax=Limosa lapponica baueri TaxID=1758121 RepID=A0A2I0T0N4_LIMLA|nr:proto-oncogene dbl [Limosa lapponica baueri]
MILCTGYYPPGGRGKDKAWIITLPDNARFNEVPEEIVSKVLTYLTSVPSLDMCHRLNMPCNCRVIF